MELVYRSGVLGDPATTRLVAKSLLPACGGIAILCGLLLEMELVARSGAGTNISHSVALALVNLMAIHLG